MKFILFLVIVLSSVSGFAASTQTVTGEVVDILCYASKGEHGLQHSDCSSKCIMEHSPVAVLTNQGDLYFPLRKDHQNLNLSLDKFAGRTVTFQGETHERNGVKVILLTSPIVELPQGEQK